MLSLQFAIFGGPIVHSCQALFEVFLELFKLEDIVGSNVLVFRGLEDFFVEAVDLVKEVSLSGLEFVSKFGGLFDPASADFILLPQNYTIACLVLKMPLTPQYSKKYSKPCCSNQLILTEVTTRVRQIRLPGSPAHHSFSNNTIRIALEENSLLSEVYDGIPIPQSRMAPSPE